MAIDPAMAILVVDDFRTMVRILRALLGQIGFVDIDDASDGSEALAALGERPYGLVICDWNMEPMTGYELLTAMRADPRMRRTPFIMVTAESQMQHAIAAKQAGADNYLVKPFSAATLKAKIESVFAARRGREAGPPVAAA